MTNVYVVEKKQNIMLSGVFNIKKKNSFEFFIFLSFEKLH